MYSLYLLHLFSLKSSCITYLDLSFICPSASTVIAIKDTDTEQES